MDGQVESLQAHDDGRAATWAAVFVGVGQFVAWSSFIGFSLANSDDENPLVGSDTGMVEVLALAAVVLVALLGSAWAAARAVESRRPGMSAWLSIVAVVAALLVALFVTFMAYGLFELFDTGGSWRPPVVGAAMGAQLAVLLPGSSLRQVVRRFGTPVLVDVIAAVVAEPLEAETGWGALLLAVGWFVLAPATVAWMERAAVTRQTTSQPTEPDHHAVV
jgi:hypothetical protein